jgi:hypothetical protein
MNAAKDASVPRDATAVIASERGALDMIALVRLTTLPFSAGRTSERRDRRAVPPQRLVGSVLHFVKMLGSGISATAAIKMARLSRTACPFVRLGRIGHRRRARARRVAPTAATTSGRTRGLVRQKGSPPRPGSKTPIPRRCSNHSSPLIRIPGTKAIEPTTTASASTLAPQRDGWVGPACSVALRERAASASPGGA